MADKPVGEVVQVDAVLDGLSSPTSSDVYEALLPFSNDAAVASAAYLALAGGGGGGGSPVAPLDLGPVAPSDTGLSIGPVGLLSTGIYVSAPDLPEQVDALAEFTKPDIGTVKLVGGGTDSLIHLEQGDATFGAIYLAGVFDDTAFIFNMKGTSSHQRFLLSGDGSFQFRNDLGPGNANLSLELDSYGAFTVYQPGGSATRFFANDSGVGFNGAYPSIPEVPATPTAQDVVDALVALGLVTQAAP